MRLSIDRRASPIGDVLIVFDSGGRLRALDFHDHEARMRRLLRLHQGAEAELVPAPLPAATAAALDAYFAGDLGAFDRIEVSSGGTPFQREVWAALRAIPAGTTTSYGRLAARLGRPAASRAVGAANGANPVAVVVPCHRLVGAGGGLTGYGGGIERKRWLLAHERTHAAAR